MHSKGLSAKLSASTDGGIDMKPERERELSLEERAELHKELEEIFFGRRRPRRPTLVCEDGVVVGDARVNVSPFDPNWRAGDEIKVRR